MAFFFLILVPLNVLLWRACIIAFELICSTLFKSTKNKKTSPLLFIQDGMGTSKWPCYIALFSSERNWGDGAGKLLVGESHRDRWGWFWFQLPDQNILRRPYDSSRDMHAFLQRGCSSHDELRGFIISDPKSRNENVPTLKTVISLQIVFSLGDLSASLDSLFVHIAGQATLIFSYITSNEGKRFVSDVPQRASLVS